MIATLLFASIFVSNQKTPETPLIGRSHGATYIFAAPPSHKVGTFNASTFKVIAQMGSGWSRIDFNRPELTDREKLRTIARPYVKQALDADVRLVITLLDWGQPPVTDEELASWSEWVTLVIQEFEEESKGGKLIWEIWNEPDTDSWGEKSKLHVGVNSEKDFRQRAREYMSVLKSATKALRSVDPHAKVIGPSTAWGATEITAFFDECKKLGLAEECTYIGVHPDKIIGGGGQPYPKQDPEAIWGRDSGSNKKFVGYYEPWSGTLKDLHAMFPTKQLAITEWPYPAVRHPNPKSTLNAEQNQAAQSLRAYLVSLADDVALHIQWEFQEEKGDPGYFLNGGIRDLNGKLRPVYYTLQSFLKSYQGWHAVKTSSSAHGTKISIEHPMCYSLTIESPDRLSRKIVKWGVAGNDYNYPETPVVTDPD